MLRLIPMSLHSKDDAYMTADHLKQNQMEKDRVKWTHQNLPQKEKQLHRKKMRSTGWWSWQDVRDREMMIYVLTELFTLAQRAVEIELYTLALSMVVAMAYLKKKENKKKMMSLRHFRMATPPTTSSSRGTKQNVGDRK